MNKKLSKYEIIIPLIIFFIISSVSIYSACASFFAPQIVSKQVMWYVIGFGIIIFTTNFKCKKVINYAPFLYVIGNVLLALLLIFGSEVNGSKCWFIIPGVGSIQPSEFMKLILILTNAKIFDYFNKKHPKRTVKIDVLIFIIVMIVTLIPSVLTFLEPDTGMVIIYFIISFVMLFVFGLRKRIFIIVFSLVIITAGLFLYYYFNYQDSFINVFGTSFFYRIDRLLDWSNKSGMQLTNATAAVKAAGLFGFGIGNTPIYIPEAHTDFIFSVYASNFGLVGTIILIATIAVFDWGLFSEAKNSNDKTYRFVILGFTAMILYQQVQNIGMNLGLLPITGITLPFISYGGSSLLSYMLGISLILNYDKQKRSNDYIPS